MLRELDAVLAEIGRVLIEVPSPLPEGEGEKSGKLAGGESQRDRGFPAERGRENVGYPVGSGKGKAKENRGVSEERGGADRRDPRTFRKSYDLFADGSTGDGL